MHENPLVMAYMGDTIYEQYVREYLIKCGLSKIGELQQRSLDYVSARSQRKHLERLENANFLTEAEMDIVKWGRNAKGAKTKHTDIVTYRLATGLEALAFLPHLTISISSLVKKLAFSNLSKCLL